LLAALDDLPENVRDQFSWILEEGEHAEGDRKRTEERRTMEVKEVKKVDREKFKNKLNKHLKKMKGYTEDDFEEEVSSPLCSALARTATDENPPLDRERRKMLSGPL
jgi:hypothetical protein